MNYFKHCRDCKPPKRHPGCSGACEDYKKIGKDMMLIWQRILIRHQHLDIMRKDFRILKIQWQNIKRSNSENVIMEAMDAKKFGSKQHKNFLMTKYIFLRKER